jgi:predicted metal-dependent phosphoesterase TrpH
MERFADLHLHSNHSDGDWSPRRLVKAARRAGLCAVAVTDHDTVSGVAEAVAAGRDLGVEVVSGVEISALEDGIDLHILGYGIDPGAGELVEVLNRARDVRVDRARRMVERLAELGMPLSLDDVLASAGGGAVGRPHVAQALRRAGHVQSEREAFDQWLGDGRPACIEKLRISANRAIALLHEAGGVALAAHPGTYGGTEYLGPLLAVGLDGVEVAHSLHDEQMSAELEAFADERGLLKAGGSDFHGPRAGGVDVGSVKIPYTWVEEIREGIRRRRESA